MLHGGLIPDIVHGPEAIKVGVAMYRIAFPGLSTMIDRLDANADLFECGWTAYAGLRGMAVRADHGGPRETLVGKTCSRLVDGQITETWMTWDAESRLCHFARIVSRARGC